MDLAVGGTAPLSVLPDISPSRGRLDVTSVFANLQRGRKGAVGETANLPLEGEMPGRVEGGASLER
ncbi:MAG: propionyl-coenzyme A carboxylase alpha polypeptide [Mesorhizobium sp.]|nr:MAG: propionyl-coenzyme A carboxylase alpha polypeptide [Mesorhizobium sp.]